MTWTGGPAIDMRAAIAHYVFFDQYGTLGPRGQFWVEGRPALGPFEMWLTGCYGDHPEGILYGD